MPLYGYDDNEDPFRVLAPRQEDEIDRRQRQSIVSSALEELTPKTKKKQNGFSDLLSDLLKPSKTPDPSLSNVASLSPQATVQTPSFDLAAGGESSPLIGRGRYKTGNGDPALREQARWVARMMGWNMAQFAAWDALINAESSWNPSAQNPTSTAFGLGQFLNGTWKPYGAKTADPGTQLAYMARYIKDRYGDPIRALGFHGRENWY